MKACIACKHFEITDGFCGSARTGFDPPEMICRAGHFHGDGLNSETPASLLEYGTNCSDFEVSLLAISKGWPL